MSQIKKLIEDALGEYNEEVDKAIVGQILKIIKTTGKFIADEWMLEIKRPDITTENSMITDGHEYVFSIKGAVKLVPKSKIPQIIKNSILKGAKIHHYKAESLPGYINIVIKGHKDEEMLVTPPIRFNFELEMRATDTRLGTVIRESLGY